MLTGRPIHAGERTDIPEVTERIRRRCSVSMYCRSDMGSWWTSPECEKIRGSRRLRWERGTAPGLPVASETHLPSRPVLCGQDMSQLLCPLASPWVSAVRARRGGPGVRAEGGGALNAWVPLSGVPSGPPPRGTFCLVCTLSPGSYARNDVPTHCHQPQGTDLTSLCSH